MINIMIVEDEELIRKGLLAMLQWQEYGFNVSAEASNGKEALEIMIEQEIDIIITDIRMPVMDGLELIKELRDRNLYLPAIIISGYKDFEYARKAIAYGVKEYIEKPINIKILLSTLLKIKKELSVWDRNNLINAVINQDLSRIEEEILKISESIYLNRISKDSVYGIAVGILTDITQILEEPGTDGIDIYQFETALRELRQMKTTEDILGFLKASCVSISEMIGKRKCENASKLVRDIKKYIQDNFDAELNIHILSKVFNYNPAYLGRYFHAYEGIQLKDYINRIRIASAVELLSKESYSIAEIAEKVGYKDINHFYRVFRKIRGCNPSKYKR